MTRRTFLAAPALTALAQSQGGSTLGFSPDSYAVLRPPRTAIEFLERAHSIGAGGVQATLASLEPDYLKQVRAKAESLGMYWELLLPMPGADTTQFEKTARAAKEAGAQAIRSACLAGRRYETFNTLEQWQAWVVENKAKIARVVPIVDRVKLPLGMENHKDWLPDQNVAIFKEYSSEYFGACIDFGNNISLLDDPIEVVEALAPYVVNTHIKDMAVEEYADGFLLAEVPLGQGILDLKRMMALLTARRPKVRFSLDMLTRDPLKIPCLTEKYWVTFPERNGRYLARALSMVRAHKRPQPLPRLTGLDREAALKMEMDNLVASIAYARDHLGLRPA